MPGKHPAQARDEAEVARDSGRDRALAQVRNKHLDLTEDEALYNHRILDDRNRSAGDRIAARSRLHQLGEADYT